jgi:hypothetical protein
MYFIYYQFVMVYLLSYLLSIFGLYQPLINRLSTGYQHRVVHKENNVFLKINIISNERMSKDFF